MSIPEKLLEEFLKKAQSQAQASNSLSYILWLLFIIAALIIGIAGWSKLHQIFNYITISILIVFFMVIAIMTLIKIMKKPSHLLYTNLEWIQVESLSDSTMSKGYLPSEQLDKNTTSPLQIEGPEDKKQIE